MVVRFVVLVGNHFAGADARERVQGGHDEAGVREPAHGARRPLPRVRRPRLSLHRGRAAVRRQGVRGHPLCRRRQKVRELCFSHLMSVAAEMRCKCSTNCAGWTGSTRWWSTMPQRLVCYSWGCCWRATPRTSPRRRCWSSTPCCVTSSPTSAMTWSNKRNIRCLWLSHCVHDLGW